MKKKSGVARGYLHGFTSEEQDRLYRQAQFLEQSVYENVDFSGVAKLIEIGCGVGAQTEILLRRFPNMAIQGVDFSHDQVSRAREHLKEAIRAGRAQITQGDAMKLPFERNSFDGAFVCWLLEHVKDPVGILREARRVLRAGSPIYCGEVLNATFYLHPYSPATLQYWFAYNDHQWNLGGDPFIGAKLANLLLAAGYQNVTTRVKVHHYDNRMPKRRAEFIEYWTRLLLSGAPSLIEAKKVTPALVSAMEKELRRLKTDRDSVFFYSWIQARAEAS